MPFPLRLLSPSPVLSVPSDSPSLSLSSLFSLARSLFRGANPLALPPPIPLAPILPIRLVLPLVSLSPRLSLHCAPISRARFLSFPLAVVFSPFYSHRSCDRTPLSLAVSFHYSSRLDCMDGIYIYIYIYYSYTLIRIGNVELPLSHNASASPSRASLPAGVTTANSLPFPARSSVSSRGPPPSSSAISVPTALSRAVSGMAERAVFVFLFPFRAAFYSVSRTALSFL